MGRRSPLILGIVLAVGAGFLVWDDRRLEPERRAACARVGSNELDHDGVRVVLGSRVANDGTLVRGHVATCREDAAATALFERVRTLVRESGPAGTPFVVVHYAPGGDGVTAPSRAETHATSGQILVARGEPPDDGILIHELVHARLARTEERETPVGVARLRAVLEEGVADYAAAVTRETPVVGDPTRGPSRDLAHPPKASESTWIGLGAPNAGFDPHELGFSLAAKLYVKAPKDRSVRDDLYRCFEGAPGKTIRETLARWVLACPARHRELVTDVLRDWAPPEVLGG